MRFTNTSRGSAWTERVSADQPGSFVNDLLLPPKPIFTQKRVVFSRTSAFSFPSAHHQRYRSSHEASSNIVPYYCEALHQTQLFQTPLCQRPIVGAPTSSTTRAAIDFSPPKLVHSKQYPPPPPNFLFRSSELWRAHQCITNLPTPTQRLLPGTSRSGARAGARSKSFMICSSNSLICGHHFCTRHPSNHSINRLLYVTKNQGTYVNLDLLQQIGHTCVLVVDMVMVMGLMEMDTNGQAYCYLVSKSG